MHIDAINETAAAANAMLRRSRELYAANDPNRVLTAEEAQDYAEAGLRAALNVRKQQEFQRHDF